MIQHNQPVSKLVTAKPTVENCDPVTRYQRSTPITDYNLEEIPVLYGGGRKWEMSLEPTTQTGSNPRKYIVLSHQKRVEVDLFALSCSFVIW